LISEAVKQLPLRVRRVEDKEKKGPHGEWRRKFCTKYSAQLRNNQQNAQASLIESLTAKGETISCRKGCTFCCFHYVTVSLAQGIVIVDYLYGRKDLLMQFLHNYEHWRKQGEAISDSIDRIRIQALSSSTPIARVIEETRPLSTEYFQANIPCPFLADSTCSIYDLRPTSCSSHHAVSPADWCAPESRHKPEIRRAMTGDDDLIKIVQLADPRLSLFELTLPTMIYRLLTEGSAALMAEVSQYD